MLNKLELISKPSENLQFTFTFPNAIVGAKEVIKTNDLSIGYDYPLIEGINTLILREEFCVIVGDNGIGKTTYLKTILNKIKPLMGSYKIGEGVIVSYLSQISDFNDNDTAYNLISNLFQDLDKKEKIKMLSKLGLTYDMMIRPLNSLSGGEQTKVRIALLTKKKSNLLILDEPTNHLDSYAKSVLKEALIKYEGTVLLVSHEKNFYKNLVNQIITFK